ncbi:MAG: hypothetical protein JXA11_09950 [Phycisphaerae bacterium]|nr:hypothetical protein [Phycisphaerae bacterium]
MMSPMFGLGSPHLLSLMGPADFVAHAKWCAQSVPPREYYTPPKGAIPQAQTCLSLDQFMAILFKYTKKMLNTVELDAEIVPDERSKRIHRIQFICIRDPGLRRRISPVYLPEAQYGWWMCDLEEVLRFSVHPDFIRTFRRSMRLRPEDGYGDREFFYVRSPELG